MKMKKEKIGEFLVRNRFITLGQVGEILKVQKNSPEKKFGAVALELGYITNDVINKYLQYMDHQ